LESWSDSRSHDGTASLVQPLIAPLYDGRSAHEVMAILASLQETPGREIVRNYWRDQSRQRPDGKEFERFWRKALHNRVISDTAFEPKTVQLKEGWEKDLAKSPHLDGHGTGLEIAFLSDPTIYDGRFANNGWLQELPKPITELTWGNAAIMSPATARRLGVG